VSQKIPLEQREQLRSRMQALAGAEGGGFILRTNAEDASDANLPRMLWFGLEPAVPDDPQRALDWIVQNRKQRLIAHCNSCIDPACQTCQKVRAFLAQQQEQQQQQQQRP
jgi:hypothetical protein